MFSFIWQVSFTIYAHRHLLLEYLTKYCPVTNSLRTALINDIGNSHVQEHLRLLGMFGKCLTGPWMTLFYGNDAGLGHLEFQPHMNAAVVTLRQFIDHPAGFLSTTTDVFGQPLHVGAEDPVIIALKQDCDLNRDMLKGIQCLAGGFVEVLERQLGRYLTGDLSDVTPELLASTKSAPAHNIASGRTLGMVDAQVRRAPNAAMEFVAGKVKYASNATHKWLHQLGSVEQEKAIHTAIHRSREASRINKERSKRNVEFMMSRLQDISQKRDKKKRAKVERDVLSLLRKNDLVPADISDTFPVLEPDACNSLFTLCTDCDTMAGNLVTHIWQVDGTDQIFSGRILKKKKKKIVPKVVISYWAQNEDEDSIQIMICS